MQQRVFCVAFRSVTNSVSFSSNESDTNNSTQVNIELYNLIVIQIRERQTVNEIMLNGYKFACYYFNKTEVFGNSSKFTGKKSQKIIILIKSRILSISNNQQDRTKAKVIFHRIIVTTKLLVPSTGKNVLYHKNDIFVFTPVLLSQH